MNWKSLPLLALSAVLAGLVVSGCDSASERCQTYCTEVVGCGLAFEPECLASCTTREASGKAPFGEECVLNEDCDSASRCILCDQYCDKLESCDVSTDSSCVSSCDTLLAGGAEVEPYQCVIDASCDEVPNCGI